jgi:O-antigen/teichoic acid export membrane protein
MLNKKLRVYRKFGFSFLSYLGVDNVVAITILNKIWSIFANLITIILSARCLTIEEQGFYYAFSGLLSSQLIIEMGMTFGITQFCSHEMANLHWADNMLLQGQSESKDRIHSIAKLAFRWFTMGAVLFACILIPLGRRFFETVEPNHLRPSNIGFAWTMAVVSTSLSLIAVPPIAILQGCGRFSETTKMRIIQSVLGYSIGWIVILSGGGILAISGINIFGFVFCAYWIIKKYRAFFKDIFKHKSGSTGISWRYEIWPFQWRMAISAVSGFFLFQMFTPMLIKTEGPASAGKMGMSLNVFQGLSAIAISWIASKTPQYGILIAKNRRRELDKLFFNGLIQSTGILLISIIGFLIIILLSNDSMTMYTSRVLSVKQLSWLGVATLANHIVYSEALYLRSHKDEPFMVVSVLSALALNLLIYLFAPKFGVEGISVIYGLVTMVISLGLGTMIFCRKRNAWNRDARVSPALGL